jgi:hypothetical protein
MKFVPRREKGRGGFKLGNLSAFGGQNGATGGDWFDKPTPANQSHLQPKSKRESGAPDYNPKLGPSWDDDGSDSYGRKGEMKKESSVGPANESEESETKRGARLKVSPAVTLLGSNKDGNGPSRKPIGADDRERSRKINLQNAIEKNGDGMPSLDAVKKTKKDKYEW